MNASDKCGSAYTKYILKYTVSIYISTPVCMRGEHIYNIPYEGFVALLDKICLITGETNTETMHTFLLF